jgi:intracellular septation protein A
MRLLRVSEIDLTSIGAVFRQSRFRAVSTGLIVLAMGILCLLVGRRQFVGWERYVIYCIGAMLLLAFFSCADTLVLVSVTVIGWRRLPLQAFS